MIKEQKTAILGIDVGGTFTDAVLVHDGQVATAKTATTPQDQSNAVIEVAEEVLEKAGLKASHVDHFAHGMTVATNALLELKGARTGMLTTEGFRDVVEIGRQARPDLYRLCKPKPAPLVPPERIFEVSERTVPDGIDRALNEDSVVEACGKLNELGVDSVAVCLLFSYKNASHERRISELIAEHLPDVHVSASHEVVSQFREYERFSTTCIDAYLSPLLARYLAKLEQKTVEHGLPSPMIMQSSGGLIDADEAASHSAFTVLSGPAGGAICSAYLGKLSGYENLIAIDMGGTSCDVSVVEGGKVRQAPKRQLAGRVIQLPMLDIYTVGAGGGSIAWRDPGGALRVGPQSAGADPGPACYGRGGTEPTVTDANLLLGYLAEDSVLAGGIGLDIEASRHSVHELAQSLGLEIEECAAGILRVANQEMLRALRVMTVERGLDPRQFALLGFGGAGPMHCAALADELGVDTVICPRASGVLSALGLAVSDRRRDLTQSVLLSGESLTPQRIKDEVDHLAKRAHEHVANAKIEASYDLRYNGQSFELNIQGPPDADPTYLREQIEIEHESRFGYTDPDGVLELVTVRVAAVSPGVGPTELKRSSDESLERLSRRARFSGQLCETEILRGEPAAGVEVEGPAIFELPEATVVVPPDWNACVDDQGSVVLRRKRS